MSLEIVKCDIGSLNELAEFYSRVTAYLYAHVNYPKWTHEVYPGRDSIKEEIISGSQYACYLGGELVGAFVLNADPKGAYDRGEWVNDIKEGEYLVIHTLAVSPACYGKGIASRMVEFCMEKGKKEGYKALRLDVVPENLPAIKLYEKAGFTYAGEKDLLRNLPGIPTFKLYELNF